MQPLTVRQLEGFVVVAEELHFGRSAARLGISQPSLSQLISRIEEIVGTALFRRRPLVRLTEAGALLLPRVREAVDALERGVAGVEQLASGRTGRLTVRFSASALASPFPTVLRHFRRQFPAVQVELLKGSSASIQVDLEGDEVGVARFPPGGGPMRSQLLVKEAFILALPNDHPLAEQATVDLKSLKNEAFVHFPRHEAPDLHDEISRACQARGFTPRVALEATEWLIIMGLVQAGLGVALVPASFSAMWGTGAEYRPLGSGGPSSEVLAWHGPDAASKTVSLFMKEVRKASP